MERFRDLTFVAFFLYIFFETKIYLALWVSVFHLINTGIKMLFEHPTIYKTVIALYILSVLIGYLYVFRGILSGKKRPTRDKRLEELKTDRLKQRRIGIAILLLIIINIASVFIFKKG
jgi:hypothetical protein